MLWIILLIVLLALLWALLPSICMIKGNRAYAEQGVSGALYWFEKACKYKHVSVGGRVTRALLVLRSGRPEEAEALLDQIIRDKKIKEFKKTSARNYRCMAYIKQGRIEDAYEDAAEMLAHGKNSTLYALVGYILLLTEKPAEEILRFCEEAYDYNPDERDICDNLAAACLKCGDFARAKELGTELKEEHPSFVEAFYHTACAHFGLGEYEEAEACLAELEHCKRHYMTTVSEEEIETLRRRIAEMRA